MIPKTIVHLLSGGLDSVTALYYLHGQGHYIHNLLVDYKQRHVQELLKAKGHCKRLGVLFTVKELPALGGLSQDDWVVPFRNALLIGLAVNTAVAAQADTVTIGCNADDAKMFPDCRKPFLKAMNRAVRAAGYDVEVCAPFIDWPKWRIGGLAQEMGIPMHEIWSCYVGGSEPCGKCPACKNLEAAVK